MKELRLTLCVATSVVVHAAIGCLETRAGSASARHRGARREAMELDFTVLSAEHPAAEVDPKAPDEHASALRLRVLQRRRAGATRAQSRQAGAQSPPTLAAESALPYAPAAEPAQGASSLQLGASPSKEDVGLLSASDLSPLAAARTLVDVALAPDGHEQTRAERDEVSAAEVGPSLDEYLARAAINPALSRADDPVLKKTGDGYSFEGSGFDATIEKDGSVRFEDRYGSVGFMVKPKALPDGNGGVTFVMVPLSVSFDLTAWAERLAGNDPYRSERRWFLERTAQLREDLALAAFRKRSSVFEQKLLRRLRAIWQDTRKSLHAQQNETFEVWDECADDEIGARGRRIVESFVAEQCARESHCAFSADDLLKLNSRRRTRTVFAPYRRHEQTLEP